MTIMPGTVGATFLHPNGVIVFFPCDLSKGIEPEKAVAAQALVDALNDLEIAANVLPATPGLLRDGDTIYVLITER